MSSSVLLVVEGPHDVAFFTKVLRLGWGFELRERLSDIPPRLRLLIPREFPPPGRVSFLQRVDVPTFLQRGGAGPADGEWVVLQSAVGESRLAETLADTQLLLPSAFKRFGLVMDADHKKSVADRRAELGHQLRRCEVNSNDLRSFVLPDDSSSGTLEDLLLNSGLSAYGPLLKQAQDYLQHCAPTIEVLSPRRESEEYRKPAGPQKALISSVTALLKPGKSVQVSIQDNRWVTRESLTLQALQPLLAFLRDLLQLEPNAP